MEPLSDKMSILDFDTVNHTVIVVIPKGSTSLPETLQKTISWQTSELVPPLSYNDTSTLFKLDTIYLTGSGLDTTKLLMYCRSQFHGLFTFLQSQVLDKSAFGWILGPPGTGKSITALAFSATIDRKIWDITWIHLSRDQNPIVVQLLGDLKRSCTIKYEDIDHFVSTQLPRKYQVIFLDGFVSSNHKHSKIQRNLYDWRNSDTESRRLVVVCSMASRYKSKSHDDDRLNLKVYYVYSWTKEEYLQAVQNDEFFNTVREHLDASCNIRNSSPQANVEVNSESVEEVSRSDLVESKYYFAGGCSRFMFGYTTARIIVTVNESISNTTDLVAYMKNTIGDQSSSVINRLFGLSPGRQFRKKHFVSEFAATEIAMYLGSKSLRNLAFMIKKNSNLSMGDRLFEMLFYADLTGSDITLFDHDRNQETWTKAEEMVWFGEVQEGGELKGKYGFLEYIPQKLLVMETLDYK
jgi:KaiC/GvpD/RAD55 family RecA-like ATPase